MKNKLIVALGILIVFASLLVACNQDKLHEHTYQSEWSADELYHWHATSCDEDKCTNPNVIDVAEHDFSNGSVCAVCGFDPATYQNYDYEYGGVEYSLSRDGSSYYVSGYASTSTGATGNVVLLNECPYDDDNDEKTDPKMLPVTHVAQCAFKDELGIESFQISKNVEYIGDRAFEGCRNLKFISFVGLDTDLDDYVNDILYATVEEIYASSSGKLKYIGKNALKDCGYILGLLLPFVGQSPDGSVSHLGYLFGQEAPKSTIDDDFGVGFLSVVSKSKIKSYAFYGCTIGQSYIVAPAMGESAYENSSVAGALLRGMSTLSNGTFRNCQSLEYVVIGEGVKSIDATVFEGCDERIYTRYGNAYYLRSVTSEYSFLVKATSKDITTCTISESTCRVNDYAFNGCANLTSVEIPNSVIGIGIGSFKNCSGISTVNFGKNVESIGDYAFANCSKLTQITFGVVGEVNVNNIGNYVFDSCTSLTRINYYGSMSDWKAISKGCHTYVAKDLSELSFEEILQQLFNPKMVDDWDNNTGNYVIACTDGSISK